MISQIISRTSVRIFSSIRNWLKRRLIHRFVAVNSKAKCPACGIVREHPLAYSDPHQCLLHKCVRCGATWGEQPMVAAAHWAVQYLPEESEKSVGTQLAEHILKTRPGV